MIRALPHVAALAPYAIAELSAPPGKTLVSLAQNESHLSPSPRAVDAAARALQAAQLYPDPNWSELRNALARHHGIAAEGILCGNGSMELISALALTFADETGAILAPAHAYPFFRTAAQIARARFDTAPETEAGVDVDALFAAVTPETRLVFVANPGNPTGTRLPRSELVRLREGLPGHVLLVIDEAYGEFADHLGETHFDFVACGDTVVLRTFSKAYGLAGLRIGWGLFPPEIAREMRKVLNPNTVSLAGQAAALAALRDQDHMQAARAETILLRDRFIQRLRTAGLSVADSFTNFALIRFATSELAASADAALRAEGLVLRGQGGAGLPHCLRATVGTAEQLDLAAEVLEHWMKGARQ